MERNWDLGELREAPRWYADEHPAACGCDCYQRGFAAGARAERERQEVGAGLARAFWQLVPLLVLGALLVLMVRAMGG